MEYVNLAFDRASDLANDEDRWITINGARVKIDADGNVIEGAGGNIPQKNDSKKNSEDTPDYVKEMKLGERQSSSYRNWVNSFSESTPESWKKRQNAEVMALFKEAESNKEVRGLMKKFLSGNSSAIREVMTRYRDEGRKAVANDSVFAFDRASVRTYDADGMMHVALTPISKANVCVYYGKEIPDAEKLGLDPNKAYRLLRDPEELRKAAPTFNNKPVLNKHLPFTVINPPKESIVGSTGTDAKFDPPYLYNSMGLHDLDSIMGVETERQKEISSSYRYRLDLTPGVYEGEAYDGVMRDIVCNHVAIVPSGRAGPDVFVYDSKPTGSILMTLKDKLMAVIKPYLANDEKPEDVEKKVDEVIKDEATQAEKDNESEAERLKREECELKEREERENKDRKRDRAEDEDDKDKKSKTADDEEGDKKEKEKMANDSRLAMDAAIKGVEARFTALRQAERDVRPVVGELACDTAEEVYRTALKQMGCDDHATLPEGALRSVFNALAKAPAMAQDSMPHHVSGDTKSDVLKMIRGGKA
ncbi:DUF2213 domain-containing protein [Klebsiella quasipneumoniae]|uniref:DUF2213 domain-containing protein n=1 Tax=Klebsiella quasipneumoniae TaxID=1463165 RepID=UPI001F550698|nr:DUF2213 domain-containing protein [Klebsiella quasipneumoniae]